MAEMNINEIMRYLPHRYPFLLVDRVLDYTPGDSIKAIKNVTMNEEFFQGHFPGHPVMPGVLIIEAMAQAAALLTFKTENIEPSGHVVTYFIGIDRARFRNPVFPGDQLLLEAKLLRRSSRIWKYETFATVNGKRAAEAVLLCTEKTIDE
jgi:3-hydroxyacyl-[acyl-carrier-protein] dehydratase